MVHFSVDLEWIGTDPAPFFWKNGQLRSRVSFTPDGLTQPADKAVALVQRTWFPHEAKVVAVRQTTILGD